MTAEYFLSFYPQFNGVNEFVLNEFIDQSNLRFASCLNAAEEARRLYVAHKLTLWAQTVAPEAGPAEDPVRMAKRLASAGVAAQSLSKSVGGVSVSKSEGSGVGSISGYGELKQTAFGVQLIELLKIATAGGRYVP